MLEFLGRYLQKREGLYDALSFLPDWLNWIMVFVFPMPRSITVYVTTFILMAANLMGGSNSLYEHQEDVVYHQAHGVALVTDIFIPKQSINGHAVIVVASGGWSSDRGKLRDLNRAGLFEELCERGFHVFAMRPGSISRFSANDMKAHVEQGIIWVKKHASDYGINKDTLALFGASAGGHLASLVALDNVVDPSEASVAAVGVFFPPADFLDYGGIAIDPRKGGHMDQVIEKLAFVGGAKNLTDQQIRERLISISPVKLVTSQAPPFLVFHGDADPLVPLQQSQSLVAALKAADVSAELIVKKGGAHPWPTIREEVVVLADWFLNMSSASQN